MGDGSETAAAGSATPPRNPWAIRAVRAVALPLGLLALLFSHPGRALHELRTLRDPNALIAPDDPAVAHLSGEIDAAMPGDLDRRAQVAWIGAFVERRIAYAHDWDQWWNVDYWPTPSETVASGREDCDGIAVLTASVLKHRGFEPRIEASYEHVWVAVDDDRILNPDTETNFDGEHWSLPGPALILSWFRYSLTSFPVWRWATLVLWVFLVARWPNRRRFAVEGAVSCTALLLAALGARVLPGFLFGTVLLACAAVTAATLFRRSPAP
ncbi:MAG: hypothetical protein IT452_15375 [Planctomycetia bacterium]|nr:hypothetical protein [Planctomycetia bacterium]